MNERSDPNMHGDVQDNDQSEDTIFGDLKDHDQSNPLAEIDFGLVETGRWMLKVIGGPNNGAEFGMQTGMKYIVGTDPSQCDIVFHDTSVSRQHAQLTVSDHDTISIEDLKSRNGVVVDGEVIKGSKELAPNTVVTLGTTSFVIFDREGEMQTIISPVLPDIVKSLKKSAAEEKEEEKVLPQQPITPPPLAEEPLPAPKPTNWTGIILVSALAALLGIFSYGIFNLFQGTPVEMSSDVDPNKAIKEALVPFPSVSYYFTPRTGQLTLVGHLITQEDKNRLIYNLQGLNFIKSIDDTGVVVDQFVYGEMNQVLERKKWRGVNMISPSPGKFVLSGYLKTRSEAEALSDYITANFPYVDMLENRVVVEENVIASINQKLQNAGLRDITVKMQNGEVTLGGSLPANKMPAYQALLGDFKIFGVRNIKDYVTEIAPEEAIVNISDRYQVTGVSKLGTNMNVVINGRILFKGDNLDGMTITEIKPNAVFLKKDDVSYRIDF